MGCGASLPVSPKRVLYTRDRRLRSYNDAMYANRDGVEMRQIQIMARKNYESEASGHYNSNVWTNTESEQRDDIFNDPVTQRIIKICGI
jgi:hypothetical protein